VRYLAAATHPTVSPILERQRRGDLRVAPELVRGRVQTALPGPPGTLAPPAPVPEQRHADPALGAVPLRLPRSLPGNAGEPPAAAMSLGPTAGRSRRDSGARRLRARVPSVVLITE
jgi:hypothetical protein